MRAYSTGARRLLWVSLGRYDPRVADIKGHHYTRIQCRRCGHHVKRYGDGNDLVGCHDRMRCTQCGHRGADLHRIYTQDPPPPCASVIPLKQAGDD